MKRLLFLSVTTAVVLGTGCSLVEKNPIYGEHGLIKDRNQEYEKATVTRPLEVPPHLRVKKTSDLLVIPRGVGHTATARQGSFEVPRPEFFYADTGSEAVDFGQIGDEKVILVDEPIADVWQKTLDFMQFNNIGVATKNAQTGTIESDWIVQKGPEYSWVDRWIKHLTFRDIPGGTRNKLQIQLRPDPENYQRTAISMQHVQYPEAEQISAVNWQQDARNVAYKSDMMFELLRYMSKATVQPTEQTLLALQNKTAAKPLLGRDSRGNPVLKIDASTDKAWQAVNSAVDRAGLDVGTRNQQMGMLYMTYITSTPVARKKERGFFEWLFSDREAIKLNTGLLSSVLGSNGDSGEIRYSSKQQQTVPQRAGEAPPLNDPNNKANQKGYKIWMAGRVIYVFGGDKSGNYNAKTDSYEHIGRYQLKLSRSRSGIYLSVLNSEGLAAPALVAEEILWSIKDNMITL